MDVFSKEKRSYVMSQIKSRDTKAEVWLRSELHRMGFRFRKNDKRLPGRSDIYLPKYQVVILVNGCFWHWHDGCEMGRLPKSNVVFWTEKLGKNRSRDARVRQALERLNLRYLVVWECALKGKRRLDPEYVLRFVEHWIVHGTKSEELSGKPVLD